ncbi:MULTISPECIES: hypothetical protein [Geomicrobium]|uniref:Uncharacterized protein n=2 Tax=Geomicrobium TaxID=767528 RepID=A0ABS2P878_9BACL|nr:MULTISPECIES: hypothetical protein [Geomicrobium]MBM7631624.1 hypothetical protein [Geomicrobium sediminis]
MKVFKAILPVGIVAVIVFSLYELQYEDTLSGKEKEAIEYHTNDEMEPLVDSHH